MVNYWMPKCEPALMDVERDNQEPNDNRNICQREQNCWVEISPVYTEKADHLPNLYGSRMQEIQPLVQPAVTSLCLEASVCFSRGAQQLLSAAWSQTSPLPLVNAAVSG
ncbi:hypothetical protein EXN66_Car000947 [Channa argus]|uniref:Uncharacterized protein n=1 Tax=Channa argus TaxID=215402 RepID=A0A6G1QZ61_CHAAH|nr:hypothetical protein EXN66_Car000947 [Channa argus]